MIERVLGDDLRGHQRMALDPVEAIIACGLFRIVISHLFIPPPALAALLLEKVEDRLAGGEFEGEIGRHPGSEIFRLMVNEEMDVAETDTQKTAEQSLGKREELVGRNMERAVALGGLDCIARSAIVERRQ